MISNENTALAPMSMLISYIFFFVNHIFKGLYFYFSSTKFHRRFNKTDFSRIDGFIVSDEKWSFPH